MKKDKIEVSVVHESSFDFHEFNKNSCLEYGMGVLYHPLGLVDVYTEDNSLVLKTVVKGRLFIQYHKGTFTHKSMHNRASRFIVEVTGMTETELSTYTPKSFDEAIRKCTGKKPFVYWKYQLQKVSKRTGEILAYKRYTNEESLRRYGSAIRESYEGSGEPVINPNTKELECFEVIVELLCWTRGKPEKVSHEEMLRLTTL